VAGKYRAGLREKRVALISPFHPEAKFNVGNAMGRNKFIYALSDFALSISTEEKKGGTWAGATEELKRDKARPVFVRMEDGAPQGNRALMQYGAEPFPHPPWSENLKRLLMKMVSSSQRVRVPAQQSIFRNLRQTAEEGNANTLPSIYDAILPMLLGTLVDWTSAKKLADELGVRQGQLDDWLKRAFKDGVIEKKSRPARYRKK